MLKLVIKLFKWGGRVLSQTTINTEASLSASDNILLRFSLILAVFIFLMKTQELLTKSFVHHRLLGFIFFIIFVNKRGMREPGGKNTFQAKVSYQLSNYS